MNTRLHFALVAALLCLLQSTTFAQNYSITGHILDSEAAPLIGATVLVLDQADSTMVAFGTSDEDGKFLIYDVKANDQFLHISYTSYKDHTELFVLPTDDNTIDMGNITMQISSEVLETVSIKAEHIPMGILGDTINYNAAAFNMRPGASVEDLLKKLPGIEVKRDGTIKAQGKEVENVLVDGKEFFSGDPTMATKNLEAEAIDKVQVFDKKSEEAEFTGVDDGVQDKTINLKLKEDYKSGGFGRVTAEGGSENTRHGKFNYNRFSPGLQASIIANTNNINEQAMSFNDYIDFMGGFQNVMSVGTSGISNQFGGPQQGITDQSVVGTNFNIGMVPKLKINANYIFAKSNTNKLSQNTSETYTDDITFRSEDEVESNEQVVNHKLSTKLKYKYSPLQNWSLDLKAFQINNDNRINSQSLLLEEQAFLRNTDNAQRLDGTSQQISARLKHMKKFKLKGRNIVTTATYDVTQQDEQLDVVSLLSSSQEDEFLNQLQAFSNTNRTMNFSSKYTEPLGKALYGGIQYSAKEEVQRPLRNYFDRQDQLQFFNEELSSTFGKNWNFHQLGLFFKKNKKRISVRLALDMQYTQLRAMERSVQVSDGHKKLYILPTATIRWTLKGMKNIRLLYRSETKSPRLSDMVTMVNNSDPNFLIVGNPNLTPAYTHTLNASYSSYDNFNFSSFFTSVNITYSQSAIVNSRSYSEDLVTRVMPINSDQHMSLMGYIDQSAPIRPLKVKYGLRSTFYYEQYNTKLDEIASKVKSYNWDISAALENKNKTHYDVRGGVKVNLNGSANALSSNLSSPFVNMSYFIDGLVHLGKGWGLDAQYDYKTFGNNFLGSDQSFHLLNGQVSKSLLSDKLRLTFSIHDVFNQNRGIQQSGSFNSFTDSRFNTLGRYVMVGVSYNLGKVKDDSF